MKRQLAIHPFLFGLFAVLALYSANVKQVSPSQVLAPAGVVLGCIVILLFIAWLIYRNMMKAGLAVSLVVVLCFSYGHVVNLIAKSPGAGYNFFVPISGSAIFLLLLWMAVGAVGVILLFRYRPPRHLGSLTTVLNVMAATLVIISTITIGVNEIRGSPRNPGTAEGTDIQLSAPQTLPDIYYIILDRYASASTLRELGFDNSEFINYLTSKGFYVAADSRDNYLNTEHSLASSLNMEYLDDLAQQVGDTCTDPSPLYAMLQDYKVWHLLKSVGYQFIHFGSWWEPTRGNKYADVNINYSGSLPEFSNLLLRTTVIDTLGRMAEPLGRSASNSV